MSTYSQNRRDTNTTTENINGKKNDDLTEQASQYQYRHNFLKNDLSTLEPQKPCNLPEIKKSNKQTIENKIKAQSLWAQNISNKQASQGQKPSSQQPQQRQQFQFNYFSEKKQGGLNINFAAPLNPYKDIMRNTNSQFTQQQSNSYSYCQPNNHNQSQSQMECEPPTASHRHGSGSKGPFNVQTLAHQSKISASKYTNIKEEKAKVSKMLADFERKQKLEKEIKLQKQSSSDLVFKASNQTGRGIASVQNTQQLEFVKELLETKPWLSCLPLRASKLEYLRKTFPYEEQTSTNIKMLIGKSLEEYQQELQFVQREVVPKRNMLREKKNDLELLFDARYFNKYGEYLYKRIQQKTYFQRLEVTKDSSKSEIKKQYFKLALIWHPDNIKKKYKYGFADEKSFTKLVAEIFQLFDEAYRTLVSGENPSQQQDRGFDQ